MQTGLVKKRNVSVEATPVLVQLSTMECSAETADDTGLSFGLRNFLKKGKEAEYIYIYIYINRRGGGHTLALA